MGGPEFDHVTGTVHTTIHGDGTVTYRWLYESGGWGESGRVERWPPRVPPPPLPEGYEPQSLKVRDSDLGPG